VLIEKAHDGLGINALSWAPGVPTAALFDAASQPQQPQPQQPLQQGKTVLKRLVTGGCDNRIKIWMCVILT
jgi:hypothetical protein